MSETFCPPPPRDLVCLVALEGGVVTGYALDRARPDQALVVDVLVEGESCGLARADQFSPTLEAEGAVDAYHGFAVSLPRALLERLGHVEIRVANEGTWLGSATLPAERGDSAAAVRPGRVRWLGGLRFAGWSLSADLAPIAVRGIVDGDQVVESRPTAWTLVLTGAAEIAVPSFDVHLPTRFADGLVHHLEMVTDEGVLLPPGRVPFVAFDDGLRQFLASRTAVVSEQARGDLLERLVPQSLPFAAFAAWSRRFPFPMVSRAGSASVAVVFAGEDGVEASAASLERQAIAWTAGVLPLGTDRPGFDPADLVEFLEGEAAGQAVVAFARGGTVFAPGGLDLLAGALLSEPGAACAYADYAVLQDGVPTPCALPAFDLERQLEQGYASGLFVMPRETALASARAGASSLFAIFAAALDPDGPPEAAPVHVPGFLATVPAQDPGLDAVALRTATREFCRRHGIVAEVEARPDAPTRASVRLRRQHPATIVTVVIPALDDAEAVRRCVAAIEMQRSDHAIEIMVVDAGAGDPAMAVALDGVAAGGVAVVRLAGTRSRARACNAGAERAVGTHLCFIDPHMEFSDPDALDEMIGRSADPRTAAVGGAIAWPSGALKDGGPALRFATGWVPSFAGHPEADFGYGDMLASAREVSGLASLFLVTPRQLYLDAGGMDAVRTPVFFPVLAYTLGLREAGHRIVFTPHARVVWSGPPEPAVRGPERQARFGRELDHLRARWGEALNADPFDSPLLGRDGPPFSALAWPPGNQRPRRPVLVRQDEDSGR